jgi:hypothetical protein
MWNPNGVDAGEADAAALRIGYSDDATPDMGVHAALPRSGDPPGDHGPAAVSVEGRHLHRRPDPLALLVGVRGVRT